MASRGDTNNGSDNSDRGLAVQLLSVHEQKLNSQAADVCQPLRFWMAAHSSRSPTVRWKRPGWSGSLAK